jgi:6-pyruvoyltetrahydropterin/6-carboxytetrahydropterin synthase
MYTLAVWRDFTAQHFLIGGDWGAENELHSHQYRIEVRLMGEGLNQHGYLIDIVDLDAQMDALVAHYQEQVLNDLPEFEDLNPSIEHFARIVCRALASHSEANNIRTIEVRVWEDEIAWTAFQQDL